MDMEAKVAIEVYQAVLHILSQDRDGKAETLLQDILEWEKLHPPQTRYDGFEWYEVHADPRLLNKLVRDKVLEVRMKTNKAITYRTIDLQALERALADYQGTLVQVEEPRQVPPNLFNIITGHDSKKDLIKRSIESEKPVHFLLWGSVASAKTLMLEELSRLPQSHFILGSALTKAGLFEVLYNERPQFLIIDELDKIGDVENLAALLSLMERGFIRETKYRRHRPLRLKTWVFAAANDIRRVPMELKSRFLLLRFRDYEIDEFYNVAVAVLMEREQIPQGLSLYIAEKTTSELSSRDVRDAVKIARLLKNKTKADVDYIVEIMKKQK